MSEKVLKAPKRRRQRGTPEHRRWRSNVSEGMRKAKARRHKAGVLTFMQTAVKYDLPLSFVKRKADLNELRVLKAGSRRYIRVAEAERVFGDTAA